MSYTLPAPAYWETPAAGPPSPEEVLPGALGSHVQAALTLDTRAQACVQARCARS